MYVYASSAQNYLEVLEIPGRNLYERLPQLKMTQIGGKEKNMIFNNLGFTHPELKTVLEPPAWTMT